MYLIRDKKKICYYVARDSTPGWEWHLFCRGYHEEHQGPCPLPTVPYCITGVAADLAGIGEKEPVVLDRHYCNKFSKVRRNANFMKPLLGGDFVELDCVENFNNRKATNPSPRLNASPADGRMPLIATKIFILRKLVL